ncbi:prephenate/arogenate dehydrogenase family protein [Alphaproteobacteria bacterium]|nr:prephenate/arogenate dehydrogenase family protein [Alphaproteobacteria bacterium]MDG2465673.1 prephenate/arogenate dehydrogenase family protein [Alphaproteobacteria bacterium]
MSHYSTVTIIGLGLIGSSLARIIKSAGLAERLILTDKNPDVLAKARTLGLGDHIEQDASRAVEQADLVVMAVPVGAMAAVTAQIASALKDGAVITDTGSTKVSVINDMAPHVPPHAVFIPSHPIAGTEYSGPEAGFESLFKDRYWIVTPNDAPAADVDRLIGFLRGTGAIVESMDSAYHDKVLAITSHLPHLIAYTIVGTAFDLEQDLQNDVIRFSASGFRDFTRIASSDPIMWRDVFMKNSDAVLEMLQRFNEDLSYLQRAIRWQEADKLEELFTRTRDIRKRIKDAGQLDS